MRAAYSPQSPAPLELFLDYMDEAGVDRAVLVQPWFLALNPQRKG